MDEEQEKPEPKISIIEILIIGPILVIFDIIGILLIFVALDDLFILDILNGLVVFYFYIRGISATRYLVTSLLELIPYVGVLPNYTLGFILTVYLDRHPKLVKTALVAAAVVATLPAGGSGGAVAAAAGGATTGAGAGAAAGAGGGAAAGGAAGGTAGAGAARTAGAAATKGVGRGARAAEETLGERREALERLKETMEKIPQPMGQEADEGDQNDQGYDWERRENEGVGAVPEPNIVDLRAARSKRDEEDEYRIAA